MGVVKTIRGEDGRPYISIEDLIKEIENVKEENNVLDEWPNFIDVVLSTLHNMEIEYYNKYLFRKKD